MATKEEDSRSLTAGEIIMARMLFQGSINYSKVKIHNEEYLWFGLQDNDTAVTPNGEMYWPKDHFKEDYSSAFPDYQWWFMHEMVHV